MSKHMSPEEFQEWSEKPGRTVAEVEERARDLQNELVDELRESAGVDQEQYIAARPQERDFIVEAGADVWLAEQAEREEAEREANPPEVNRLAISEEPDDDTLEIEVPAGGALDKKMDEGLVKGSFDEDSAVGQELVQAAFIALHPEFSKSVDNANLIRDRVAASGARYFTLENIEQAFRELVAEGAIDLPYSFK